MSNQITPEIINTLSLGEKEEKLLNEIEDTSTNKQNKICLDIEDIHPNLLLGLFPMYGPVGIGTGGELLRAKSRRLTIPENMERMLEKYNLHLIAHCVLEAKREGWKYFYQILAVPSDNSQLIIRGC